MSRHVIRFRLGRQSFSHRKATVLIEKCFVHQTTSTPATCKLTRRPLFEEKDSRLVTVENEGPSLLLGSLTKGQSLRCITLLGCQAARELIRGGGGPTAGRVGVPPWSDPPLNRTLHVPFSISACSSNIFIASLVLS